MKIMSKLKKSHITLRIDAANLEKIKQEAQEKNLTTNVLINQILNQHTAWHSYAPQAGMISLWRDIPLLLLDKYTLSDLEKLAKRIVDNNAKDTAILLNTEFSSESLIRLMKNWLKVSGFPYKYEKSNSVHKLIMQFDMSKKWSFFVAKCCEETFHILGETKIKSEITDNSLILTIKETS